ncbi:MAG TPA: caspase family protein [Pseudomonadota bacterium]|nr:caspase family protein [Pseudomonadota bacterium]
MLLSLRAWPGLCQPVAAWPSPEPVRRPQVVILSTQVAKDGTIIVETQVEDPAGGQVELNVLLDGQPLRAVAVAQGRGLAMANRYTLTVTPPRRDGVLSLVARNRESESSPAQLRIRRGAPERRPALYVLSVGVGRYESPDIPTLRFAAKDASDLAVTLQRQRDLLYREITVRVLTDAQATREAIVAGLKWLTDSVATEDTAVLFLAGHGTNDPDGAYYYLPVDAQADRDSMLSGAALQEALHGIRSRVVLLLDTCHSGNVLGRKSFNRLLADLTSENRIVVFAASTGDQVARESPAWANGAFTKALVEGLRGVADYAEDNQISMSELETWASLRVAQLTGGTQTPTLAKPNAVPDYVLSALPEQGVLPNPKRAQRRRLLAWSGGVSLGLALGVGITVGVVVRTLKPENVLTPTWSMQ